VELSSYQRANPDRAYRIEEVFEMPDRFSLLSAEVERKIRKWKMDRRNRSEEHTVEYKPEFLGHDLRGFVQGYFPSFKYSEGIEHVLRKNFRFRQQLPARNASLAEELADGDSVAVHVRRGDYLNPENKQDFFGMCSPAYYQSAIGYIRQRRPAARFYFFSDDPAWCVEEFGHIARHVVVGNVGLDAWADMDLISRCRHSIIANSSYSLWARWIGSYGDGGINISPDQFFNGGAYGSRADDIFPDAYVRINNQGLVAGGATRS
jgi:hypothetical protein